MDFRSVTDLFADPDFNGDPLRVKELGQDDEFDSPEEETEASDTIVDEEGDEAVFDEPKEPPAPVYEPDIIDGGDIIAERRQKYYVNGVDMTVLNERIQYLTTTAA